MGGRTWDEQVTAGLDWLGDIDGLRILDIGTRHGGMAILLATRGGLVTGLDITDGRSTRPEREQPRMVSPTV